MLLSTDSLTLFWDVLLKQSEAAAVNHDSLSFVTWDNVALLPLKLFAVILVSLVVISKSRKFTYRHLKSFALLTFLSGVAIYGIGFNTGGCHDNYLALGWRACMSSLEMFTSHSDLVEVDLELHHNPLYMTIFCIIHFLAVCVSAIALVKLFGYQLYSWIKGTKIRMVYYWDSHLGRGKIFRKLPGTNLEGKRFFIFWGVNDNSITLAESIHKQLSGNDVLIFVSLPGDSRAKASASRFTFSHFFHSPSESVSLYIDRLEQTGALLMNADAPVNSHLLKSVDSVKGLYSRLRLKNLGSMLNYLPSSQEVDFYFLSDNEYENTEAVSVFRHLYGEDRKDCSNLPHLHLYCHARRNSFNEQLLLRGNLPDCKIDLVDTSLLSVRQLKKDLKCQPVSFVDKDGDSGVVLSPYHALIIGFGDIGQDAFRFLYEFASFVGNEGKEDLKHFYISDPHLQGEKTRFLNSAPALRQKTNIEWWDDSYAGSSLFWEKLKDIINLINQIVICVSEDEEAKLLLSQLCDFAYRYRTDFHNFQIQVRIKDDLYADQVGRFGSNFSEKTNDFIRTFGSTASLFNYEVFSVELQEREAKDFYYQYKYISNAFESSLLLKNYMTRYLKTHCAEEVWERRKSYKDPSLRLNEEGKEVIADDILRHTMDDDTEMRYQEEQDFSNAWHKYTKCALAGVEMENGRVSRQSLPRFEEMVRLLTRNGKNEYPNVTSDNDRLLIDHLSGCEHLRWVAKMELLGFVYRPGRKSLKARTNACIVSYADLKKDPNLAYTIAYDTGVVELSFTSFLNDKIQP